MRSLRHDQRARRAGMTFDAFVARLASGAVLPAESDLDDLAPVFFSGLVLIPVSARPSLRADRMPLVPIDLEQFRRRCRPRAPASSD